MRHLFISASLCLTTWSSAIGPEPTLPLDNISATATSASSSGSRCEAAVLPLARIYPLLKPIVPRSREEICSTLVDAARSNDLPAPFFIRLLYQESNFRPGAISSAGALGIAQFMPETATERGVDNPFDPLQAIPASAHLLRDLYQKFGNLGLAAAAYNAGPKRVQDWLTSKGQLPQETQYYVNAITGWPAEQWKTVAQAGSPAVKLPEDAPCEEAAGLLAWNGPDQIPLPARNPRTKKYSAKKAVARQSPAGDRISHHESTTASGLNVMAPAPHRHHSQSELSSIKDRCAPQDHPSIAARINLAEQCPQSRQ
jgi:hypothetical protein